MKRVVLTGATGFVGANLARRLLRDGHEVHLLVRRDHDPWRIEEIRREVHLHEVDLGDGERLVAAARVIRPEWVFHLAAYGGSATQTDLDAAVRTNFLGTINLVRACLAFGFETFVNTGSSSEYGFKDHAPSEAEALEPNSWYAVTKASATLFCGYVARREACRIVTLRLYSAYGPFEEPTRLMPTLILTGLEGRLPPLVDPDVARDYVYVDDVVEAYLRVAGNPGVEAGAVYNVGTGVQVSVREVVEVARRVLGIPVEPVWGSMPNRGWDTTVWLSDPRKIRDEVGWRPAHAFEDGFRLMVRWFEGRRPFRDLYRQRLSRTSSAEARSDG